jgi:hypothetical protein
MVFNYVHIADQIDPSRGKPKLSKTINAKFMIQWLAKFWKLLTTQSLF